MARFLSEAWVSDLAVAAGDAEVEPEVALAVEQVVTGTPDGDVRYGIRVADGRVTVVPGGIGVDRIDDGGGADVVLAADWPTAVAVARGEVGVIDAFTAGRLRVSGDVTALLRAGPALAVLDGLTAAVRERTTY